MLTFNSQTHRRSPTHKEAAWVAKAPHFPPCPSSGAQGAGEPMSPVYLDRLAGLGMIGMLRLNGPTSKVPGGMWERMLTLGALGLSGQAAWGTTTTTTTTLLC